MSTKTRYREIICKAIENMWRDWGREEPLYLTASTVGERAGVSRVTAQKHLEEMHCEGWIGRKNIGKKLIVYPTVL